jgi:hypothetical protein
MTVKFGVREKRKSAAAAKRSLLRTPNLYHIGEMASKRAEKEQVDHSLYQIKKKVEPVILI